MTPVDLLNKKVATAFYGSFTSVRQSQQDVIEPLVNGDNIVLSSGTGSGKTEAVVAPIISRYYHYAVVKNELFLVYISPTKALVNDLFKRLYPPLTSLGLHVGIRHGDRDDLKTKRLPNILITTPESLDVILFRKDQCLNNVKAIILDEVHILYNTQRGLQLSLLIKRLQSVISHKLQWAALSATVGEVSFVRDFLMGPEDKADFFSYSSERSIDCEIRHIRHLSELQYLLERLMKNNNRKLLLFADSRKECERLSSSLSSSDILAPFLLVHYSSLSQQVRVETERKFESSKSALCIATSTLELGIDIGDIDAVIIWGCPDGVESFMQRIGRGNRRSNKVNVICLVPDYIKTVFLELLKFCVLLDSSVKGVMPRKAPYELYGSVAQQCLSILASDEGSFLKTSHFYDLTEHLPHVCRSAIDELLNELEQKDYVKKHDFKYRYAAYEKLHKLKDLRMIYGNISLGSRYVQINHESKNLGEVPEINLLKLRRGCVVRFQGRYWRVKNLTPSVIYLKPTDSKKKPVDFTYYSGTWMADPFILNNVWKILNSDRNYNHLFEEKIGVFFNTIRTPLRKYIEESSIPYYRSHNSICYFTFGGQLVNRAIALIQNHCNFEINDISIVVSSPVHWDQLSDNPQEYESIFPKLFDKALSQSLFQMLLPLNMQLYEYLQYWLKDEAIFSILSRLKNSTPIEISQEQAILFGFEPPIE
ncbi:MAG: DEAD/DEAH box helicase [Candidatus Cloacimonetes bacterium]|nr:DEAD/DEAH box helicase [Candidatus Cloacimonadota bacterium]